MDALPDLARQAVFRVRGQAVILDADIAALFGRKTGAVNQSRTRNAARFPADYAFQLTDAEWADLTSQSVISSAHGGRRSRPWAYTEQGFILISLGFKGDLADRIARVVTDTFVAYRQGALPDGPVLTGPRADVLRNSLRDRIYGMIDAIAAMPLPGGSTASDEFRVTSEKTLGRIKAWLDQPKLQNARLEAEIAKLAADTQKAFAEILRTDAETANIWADTLLKRLEAVRQLRLMATQIDRDDIAGFLHGFDQPIARVGPPDEAPLAITKSDSKPKGRRK